MLLYSQNPKSKGGRDLAKALGCNRIRHTNSKLKGSKRKVVINWGASEVPEAVSRCTIINKPELLSRATNKLKFFEAVSGKEGICVPDWTTSFNTAVEWVGEGNVVCARTVLQGHSGEGIVLMHPNDTSSFVKAPLYTKYVKKKQEYRVHIVNGAIIDFQRKALRSDVSKEDADWQIRNHDNGFIYMRENVQLPDDARVCSLRVMEERGLDFGAVDIIWNQKQNKSYVLEVNTAPGLEGTTLNNYVNAFRTAWR